MHPPDSYTPYQPPTFGQQTPGQYAAHHPGQYQPAYPYPYPYPPPPPAKRLSTRTIVLIVVAVVVLVIFVPLILAGVLMVYLQAQPSSGGSTDGFTGIHAEKTTDGDWLLAITSGGDPASSLTLQIIDPSNGQVNISMGLPSTKPTYNNPDAVYNDSNGNNKLDAGDSILLKASGGHVQAGDRVQFMKGDSIIATVNALPA